MHVSFILKSNGTLINKTPWFNNDIEVTLVNSPIQLTLQTFLGVFVNNLGIRAVFTWLSKGIGFGFGFGFTTPFGWLVYLLWFWFYDSQVKTALSTLWMFGLESGIQQQEQHFISPHNIQEIKIYNNSTDDDRGAGCPK